MLCGCVCAADEPAVLPDFADDATDEERRSASQAFRIADFKHKHRRVKRNWGISSAFPNRAVIDAYWHPNVDRSAEPFSWRQPDWEGLAQMCASKMGWTQEQIEQQFGPVVKAMEQAVRRAANASILLHVRVLLWLTQTCAYALYVCVPPLCRSKARWIVSSLLTTSSLPSAPVASVWPCAGWSTRSRRVG